MLPVTKSFHILGIKGLLFGIQLYMFIYIFETCFFYICINAQSLFGKFLWLNSKLKSADNEYCLEVIIIGAHRRGYLY